MATRHAHEDDVVEVELKRGSAKVRAALKGLDAKKQKQVLDAVETCVREGIGQALDWAAEHTEESDALLVAAADDILRAAAESSDEPTAVGRVYGTLRLLGLEPDVQRMWATALTLILLVLLLNLAGRVIARLGAVKS